MQRDDFIPENAQMLAVGLATMTEQTATLHNQETMAGASTEAASLQPDDHQPPPPPADIPTALPIAPVKATPITEQPTASHTAPNANATPVADIHAAPIGATEQSAVSIPIPHTVTIPVQTHITQGAQAEAPVILSPAVSTPIADSHPAMMGTIPLADRFEASPVIQPAEPITDATPSAPAPSTPPPSFSPSGTPTPNATPVFGATPSGSAYEGHGVSGTAAASDSDGDAISWSVGNGSHGTTTINSATGAWSYTPTAGFTGSDSFAITANDGQGATITETASIAISPDTLTIGGGGALSAPENGGTVPGAFTASSAAGDAVAMSLASDPAHGTLTLSGLGYSYQADAGYSGSDAFNVNFTTANGGSSTATVSVSVTGPVFSSTPSLSVYEDGSSTASVVATSSSGVVYSIDGNGSHGTATINSSTGLVSYTATTGYSGSDSLTIRATDASGAHVDTALSVSVSPATIAGGATLSPFVHSTNAGSGYTDTALSSIETALTNGMDPSTYLLSNGSLQNAYGYVQDVSSAALLAGTTDSAGHSLTITAATLAGGQAIADGQDGLFLVSPYDATGNGSHDLTLTVSDGHGGSATIVDSISQTDAPPVLSSAGFATGTTLSGSTAVSTGGDLSGTATATDANGDTLTYSITAPSHGIAVIDATTGAWAYVPVSGYVGADNLQIAVSDGHGGSTALSVAINDAPVMTWTADSWSKDSTAAFFTDTGPNFSGVSTSAIDMTALSNSVGGLGAGYMRMEGMWRNYWDATLGNAVQTYINVEVYIMNSAGGFSEWLGHYSDASAYPGAGILGWSNPLTLNQSLTLSLDYAGTFGGGLSPNAGSDHISLTLGQGMTIGGPEIQALSYGSYGNVDTAGIQYTGNPTSVDALGFNVGAGNLAQDSLTLGASAPIVHSTTDGLAAVLLPGATNGTTIESVAAHDIAGSAAISYSVVNDASTTNSDSYGLFSVDPNSGAVSVSDAAGLVTGRWYEVTVEATNGTGTSLHSTFIDAPAAGSQSATDGIATSLVAEGGQTITGTGGHDTMFSIDPNAASHTGVTFASAGTNDLFIVGAADGLTTVTGFNTAGGSMIDLSGADLSHVSLHAVAGGVEIDNGFGGGVVLSGVSVSDLGGSTEALALQHLISTHHLIATV